MKIEDFGIQNYLILTLLLPSTEYQMTIAQQLCLASAILREESIIWQTYRYLQVIITIKVIKCKRK